MSELVIVRGGGDLATGTIHRLWAAGFRVLVLETGRPAAIRRQVSLCEAIYQGSAQVEDLRAVKIDTLEQAQAVWDADQIPMIVDPDGESIRTLKPAVVVDAILAKVNLGTSRDMAPCTIALGPGFVAGQDVDVVIETSRGHKLGRVIKEGPAKANTGIPGIIGGYGKERVIHSPARGVMQNVRAIGDIVKKDEIIAWVLTESGRVPVPASISGIIRGLIRDGYPVPEGFKIADIDPRENELENCWTISDKARCIAGSVLEQVCAAVNGK